MTTTVINTLYPRLTKQTSILPLIIFRVAFGFLMCFSQFRFLWNGWVEGCYIAPKFHFTYQYFDWIAPLNGTSMYVIVIASALFALCIGLGLFYRVTTVLFFLSFTYLELIEKSWYLNHYYFVSLVAFLLIWLPANRNYSLDVQIFKTPKLSQVPVWSIMVLKLQLVTVYFFGGVAKLKSDWLIEAQPLKIWLQARTDTPLIGSLFEYDIMPYIFSWSGMLYDLTIPFLLWNRRSRPLAYALVVLFHILTFILFNIGMFPWLMIAGSLIFITADEWRTLCNKIGVGFMEVANTSTAFKTNKLAIPFLLAYLLFQLLFPLRHFVLTDHVLWTEKGFRFSWHVMVMEKNGHTDFEVVDNESQKRYIVYPTEYLTNIQEKQMSFQPDMIWQFAQFLGQELNPNGEKDISIYVNSKVSLNGRPSQDYIDKTRDLLEIKSVNAIYDYVLEPEIN